METRPDSLSVSRWAATLDLATPQALVRSGGYLDSTPYQG